MAKVKIYYKLKERMIYWKNGYICNKCNYVWIAKSEIPLTCPNCSTARWNLEKKK